MDGNAVTGELESPALRFALATEADDANLRRLLRQTPMRGSVSLSLEREPSYFAAANIEGPEHQTIIAMEKDRLICAGSIAARQMFINGEPMRVGYLGVLRLDATCRARTSVLRRGYDYFRQLHERGGPRIYLSSIASDNAPARRLLERGLPGMPTYRPVGELVTLVVPCKANVTAARRPSAVVPVDIPAVLNLLNSHNRQFQFAPVWSSKAMERCTNLHHDDFHLRHDHEACAALWDQRPFKQTVIRGYSRKLAAIRPFANLLARVLRNPRLPAVGKTFSHAYLSHLAADVQQPAVLVDLIRTVAASARRRRIDYLTLALDARDLRLMNIRKYFRPREYRTTLYAVHWADGQGVASTLDDRLLGPEVALL